MSLVRGHRSFLARAGMTLFGLVLGIATLEFVLRVSGRIPEVQNPLYSFHESDPELGWRGKPKVALRFIRPEFDVLVENDDAGWRVPRPAPPRAAPLSILFLGDSFTWGWGIDQGEIFTDVLQAAAGSSVEIINRGVSGYSAAQELILLRRILAERRVDRVVVVLCENDFREITDAKGGRRPGFAVRDDGIVPTNQPARPLMGPLKKLLKEHSRAFLLMSFLASRSSAEADQAARPSDANALPNEELALRIFAEIAQLCRAHGAEFFVAPIPVSGAAAASPATRYEVPTAMAAFVARLEHLGFGVIDLAGPLSEALSRDQAVVFPVDGHWNRDGHRVVADAIADAGLLSR